MKKYTVAALVFSYLVAGDFGLQPAGAQKAFLEQFKALYVKKSADRTALIFNEAVDKKKCALCHHGKPKRSGPFNAYGEQLQKLLTKNDAQDAMKIRGAMKKVAGMKSDPSDPASETFGKRLSQGKLPCGEITVRSKDAEK